MSIPAGTLRERTHKTLTKRPREVTPASLHSLQPLAAGAILQRAPLASEPLRPSDFLRLQQTIGNQALGRLLDRPSWPRPIVQAKLTVNAPGDEYEREADRVGEQMRTSPREPPSPSLHRRHGRENDNTTGMPDHLKAGIECLSGLSLADVKVHYDSSLPAELQALAYTQGTDIHVGPGQEKHLPHEAWHVVQQKQGRVPTTLELKGASVNDEGSLEREADVMGSKANTLQANQPVSPKLQSLHQREGVIQRKHKEGSRGYLWFAALRKAAVELPLNATEDDLVAAMRSKLRKHHRPKWLATSKRKASSTCRASSRSHP